jgi:hypothetical protein
MAGNVQKRKNRKGKGKENKKSPGIRLD